MSSSEKILEGVKVVELATFIAAPACGRFLADLGAEVIKIEAFAGDPVRYTAPSEGRPLDQYENTTFDLENANKKGITLNLKQEGGRQVLFKLLDEADVFITNWRPDALVRAGLNYEKLKEKYPKLVYAQLTGYGEKGPDKDLPGFDFTAFFARGGLLGTLYEKGTVPMNVVPGLGDHQAGMFLVAGITSALYHAEKTGKGEKVSVSLFHSAVYTLGMMIQASQYGHHYPINRCNTPNPFTVAYQTKDERFLQLCMPPYDMYFPRLAKAIGREDIAEDEKYCKIANIKGREKEVYDILTEQFKLKTVAEWKEILTKADLPFAVAQVWEEILEDEQAWANNILYSMQYDNGNTRTLVRPPVQFAEMGVPEYVRGPLLGEHSEEVLEKLGYTQEEIQTMKENKEFYIWEENK